MLRCVYEIVSLVDAIVSVDDDAIRNCSTPRFGK
jgi:hypothetical protein